MNVWFCHEQKYFNFFFCFLLPLSVRRYSHELQILVVLWLEKHFLVINYIQYMNRA